MDSNLVDILSNLTGYKITGKTLKGLHPTIYVTELLLSRLYCLVHKSFRNTAT